MIRITEVNKNGPAAEKLLPSVFYCMGVWYTGERIRFFFDLLTDLFRRLRRDKGLACPSPLSIPGHAATKVSATFLHGWLRVPCLCSYWDCRGGQTGGFRFPLDQDTDVVSRLRRERPDCLPVHLLRSQTGGEGCSVTAAGRIGFRWMKKEKYTGVEGRDFRMIFINS